MGYPLESMPDGTARLGDYADVAAAIAAKAATADLASTATGKGASLQGVEDADDNFEATTTEGVLAEIGGILNAGDGFSGLKAKAVVISLGASSGSSAADADCIDGTVISITPVSGNDQVIASNSVGVDGAVTVTTAAVETAEATFIAIVSLAD